MPIATDEMAVRGKGLSCRGTYFNFIIKLEDTGQYIVKVLEQVIDK